MARVKSSALDGMALAELRKGAHRLQSDADLFQPRADGMGYTGLMQGQLFGSWTDRLADSVRNLLAERVRRRPLSPMRKDEVIAMDLAGLVEVDPIELASAIRKGIKDARKGGGRSGPARLAITWKLGSSIELPVRAGFALAWEMLDRLRPDESQPVPWSTEDGVSILGHLPTGLIPPGVSELVKKQVVSNRLLTYHAFAPGPVTSLAKAKSLGRLLTHCGKLGLLIPRGYATRAHLEELGIAAEVHSRARLQLWESVAAAAAGKRPGRMRRPIRVPEREHA